LVASAWSSWQSGRGREPVPEARVVARAVAGMVVDPAGDPAGAAASAERAAELGVVLRSLVGGRLRLLDARAAYVPEDARWAESAAVLAAAFLFALVPAGLLGYLLSRRLTGRLERLGQVAAALAAGDLSRRVEEGPADEIGQLAGRFNRMASDLEATLRDLRAE